MITASRASLREQAQDLRPAVSGAVVDAALSGDPGPILWLTTRRCALCWADLREADLSGATGYAIDPRETPRQGRPVHRTGRAGPARSLRYRRHRVTQTLDARPTVSVVIPVYQGAATHGP